MKIGPAVWAADGYKQTYIHTQTLKHITLLCACRQVKRGKVLYVTVVTCPYKKKYSSFTCNTTTGLMPNSWSSEKDNELLLHQWYL